MSEIAAAAPSWERVVKRGLGKYELAQTLTSEYGAFNVVAVLRLAGGPTPKVLERALEILGRRHPLLSARIVRERGRRVLTEEGAPVLRPEVRSRDHDDVWQDVVDEGLNQPLDAATGPLVRLVYLVPASDSGQGEIVLTFHHVVVDAPSGEHFCHQLLTLCDQLERGQAPRFLEPLPALPPVETFFPSPFRGAAGSWRLIRFLSRQFAEEVAYRLRAGIGNNAPSPSSTRNHVLTVQMSEESTSALLAGARRQRVTLHAALQAAMLRAVACHRYAAGGTPLRYMLFNSLRPYLDPPVSEENLGSYFSMMRHTIPVDPAGDTWALARRIDEQTYAAAKRGDKYLGVLASAWLMRAVIALRRLRMSTIALNYSGPARLDPEYGTIRLLAVHAFVSNVPIGAEYTGQARLQARRLWWDIVYLDSDMSRAEALVIARDMLSNLTEPCG